MNNFVQMFYKNIFNFEKFNMRNQIVDFNYFTNIIDLKKLKLL